MTTRLEKILFVYDKREGTFPERWRITCHEESIDPEEFARFTGTVQINHLDRMRRQLEAAYPKARYDVSTSTEKNWETVHESFRSTRNNRPTRDSDKKSQRSRNRTTRRLASDWGRAYRNSMGALMPERSQRIRRWTTLLLVLYVASSLIGAAILVHALSVLPGEFPRLTLAANSDVRSEVEAIHQWVLIEIPAAADWLAPMGLFNFDNDLQGLLSPSEWQLENTTLSERVGRLNRSIESIREYYLDAASLLGVVFFGGFIFACVAFVRPNLGTAFVVFLFPLFTTPIATEPLINVDNMGLFYATSPMLLTGGAFLVIEIGRAIGSSISGPRADAWLRVWIGVWLVVVGAVATVIGILLSEAMNAGAMVIAVGPVVYGLFSIVWGLVGLVMRRR